MTMLLSASFAASAMADTTVSVARFCRTSHVQPVWIVTVRDQTTIIRLHRFTSINCALGFASQVLEAGAS